MKVRELYGEVNSRIADARQRDRDAMFTYERADAANDLSFLMEVRSALRRGFKSLRASPSGGPTNPLPSEPQP